MANTPAWFIKEDYLASKLAQLIASGETEYETPEQVEEAIEAEGFTAFEHFEKFGGEEKTSPNAYFDVAYYLQAKADELNANADEPRDDWTAEEVYDAIIAEGLTPWSHFQAWGWKEGVNPSADFDLNAYFEDKLQQLIDNGETEYETVDDVIAAFEVNGIDPITHYYAWGADEGLTPKSAHDAELGQLTEALEVYQDAAEALDDFLAEAAENDDVADWIENNALDPENPTEENIRDGIAASVGTAKQRLNNPTSPTYDNYDTADDDVIPAMIAADEKTLAEDLADAEEDVAGVPGLKTAINAAVSANTRYNDAVDAAAAATLEVNGEIGRYNGLNGEEFELVGDATIVEGAAFINDGTDDLIVLGANGKLEAAAGVDTDADGFAELLASAQAAYDAMLLEVSREGRLQEAIARVIDVENGDPAGTTDPTGIDPAAEYQNAERDLVFDPAETPIAEKYISAKNAVAAFAEAVAAFNEINALVEGLDAHDTAVTDAIDAIDELGYNLVEFDPETNEAVGTEESDVFVYIGADEATIDLFGEVGDDVLFIGTEYTFNDDIENGDASALEVFFTQDGDDVVVTIEQVPFGTNADVQEIDTITLTGVSIDNLVFDQGYVQFVA